jgi:citrate synthase
MVTISRRRHKLTEYKTGLGTSDADNIYLLGQDLANDLMGKVGFGELAFWMATKKRPTPGQVRLFEAVLVSLADHGFTPTAIAARMTYYSAPDSIQGAIAAGLLGGGSRFLGVTEDTGKFLNQRVKDVDTSNFSEEDFKELAISIVTEENSAKRRIPGLGHPVHKNGDPRTPVMFQIAKAEGVYGPHLALYEAIGEVHESILGKKLPLNGAGVGGAALADLGLPIDLLRGFALLARTAGLVGHLAEEHENPIGPDVYYSVDRNAVYEG